MPLFTFETLQFQSLRPGFQHSSLSFIVKIAIHKYTHVLTEAKLTKAANNLADFANDNGN